MQNIQERLPEVNALEAEAFRAVAGGSRGRCLQALEPDSRARPEPRAHADRARPARVSQGRHGVRPRRLPAPRRRRRIRCAAMDPSRHRLPEPRATSRPRKRRFDVRWKPTPPIWSRLILRANLLERKGKTHEAARAYGAVARVAPPIDRLRPELRPAVARGARAPGEIQPRIRRFLDQYLDSQLRKFAGEKLRRFRDSVDIMVGRKRDTIRSR